MKKQLAILFFLLCSAAPASAQFGGRIGSAVPNIIALVERSTITFTAPITFTAEVIFATAPVVESTVSVNAPILGDGSVGDPLRLDSSSVTLQGNSFNAANELVQLDGAGALPVLDGGALTNINATITQLTTAVLQTTACATHPGTQCLYHNITDFDLYTSTGSGAGQSRNTRLGTGP